VCVCVSVRRGCVERCTRCADCFSHMSSPQQTAAVETSPLASGRPPAASESGWGGGGGGGRRSLQETGGRRSPTASEQVEKTAARRSRCSTEVTPPRWPHRPARSSTATSVSGFQRACLETFSRRSSRPRRMTSTPALAPGFGFLEAVTWPPRRGLRRCSSCAWTVMWPFQKVAGWTEVTEKTAWKRRYWIILFWN